MYIIKAYDYDGNFYGYFAPHPDDNENKFFSYYVDEPENAKRFETWDDADCIIERFADTAELDFEIEQIN